VSNQSKIILLRPELGARNSEGSLSAKLYILLLSIGVVKQRTLDPNHRVKVDFNNDALNLSDAESEANEVKICLRNTPGQGDVFVIVSPKHFVEEQSNPKISCPNMPKIHGNM